MGENLTKGFNSAPRRSLYNALGLTKEELVEIRRELEEKFEVEKKIRRHTS